MSFEKRKPHEERLIIDDLDVTDNFELLVEDIHRRFVFGSMEPNLYYTFWQPSSSMDEFFEELKLSVCRYTMKRMKVQNEGEIRNIDNCCKGGNK